MTWVSNLSVFISLGFIIFASVRMISHDLFIHRTTGVIVGSGATQAELPNAATAPGFSYTIEYEHPKSGKKYQTIANPISIADNAKVGDPIEIQYDSRKPESEFQPASTAHRGANEAMKVILLFSVVIIVTLVIRAVVTGNASILVGR